MKISLQTKLTISFGAVIIICGLVAALVGMRLIGTVVISQAQEKVKNDLNSAREIYREETENIKDVVRFTALRFFIKGAILDNDTETLTKHLQAIRQEESLDILTLTDGNGRVLVRTRNPAVIGDNQANDELVSRVLSEKKAIAGSAIISREELIKEDNALAEQAYIKFVPTPKAKPSLETEQTSGMMLKAAAPIFGYDGSLIGILYGGNLLNRNYKIVDKVKETVYRAVKYKGKDIGTATIFQEDLRISTNVAQEDGTRAIGTRVSEKVYEQVLMKGLPWISRAFVVNNWYISAYEPIKNVNGKTIGVLYVGILEEKFMDMRKRTVAIFLGIAATGMLMAFIVAGFLARGLLHPIKNLAFASGQWAEGNLGYRIKAARNDEIAELSETFNIMASSLKERDDRLKEYTSRQIMKSERLATLGQLAAGIAHEINNPLGAILMYSHLVLENLQTNDPLRKNLEKAIAEAARCRDIVKGLLDFARQTEPDIRKTNVNEVVERTLALLRNQTLFQNVKITKLISPSLPDVLIDAGQIQQVFTNIIFNAAEAMDGKGELTVATKMERNDNEYVVIEFTDTGCGIPPQNLNRIFDPFFTTKEVGRGTGLGLSISHGIISRHGGSIEAKSKRNKGATFIVKLPISRKET